MFVGPVVGELLYLLARISKATRILELGCATGYSAIHLARALDMPEGRLITLENNEDMATRAQAGPCDGAIKIADKILCRHRCFWKFGNRTLSTMWDIESKLDIVGEITLYSILRSTFLPTQFPFPLKGNHKVFSKTEPTFLRRAVLR